MTSQHLDAPQPRLLPGPTLVAAALLTGLVGLGYAFRDTEFVHHYVEIMSDPAHVLAEVTFILLIDGLAIGLIWPLARGPLRRWFTTAVQQAATPLVTAEHQAIDTCHGVPHQSAPAAVPASIEETA